MCPPPHLQNDYGLLYSYLHGISPSNVRTKDIRGWGLHSCYTVNEGYKTMKNNKDNSRASFWKKVWNSNCIPKINTFIGY